MRRIAIYGAGGHAKSALEVALEQNCEVLAFIEDVPSRTSFCGVDVLGEIPDDYLTRRVEIHFGVGSNLLRFELAQKFSAYVDAGLLCTLIHSTAVVSKSAKIGAGALVMPHGYVGPSAEIGISTIVNTGAIVEHDSLVGDFASIGPGAALAGGVAIGKGSLVGMKAAVLEKLSIGSWVTVGAQSLVTKNIPDNTLGYGVPFKAKAV